MKNLILFFCLLVAVAGLNACKKKTPAGTEVTAFDGNRTAVLAAQLIPVKMELDAQQHFQVYFKLQEKPYFLHKDNPQVNPSLNTISAAIKAEKLINLYMYKGTLEIARAE